MPKETESSEEEEEEDPSQSDSDHSTEGKAAPLFLGVQPKAQPVLKKR